MLLSEPDFVLTTSSSDNITSMMSKLTAQSSIQNRPFRHIKRIYTTKNSEFI